MHTDRKNERQADLWNIACDYEVHNMLYIYKEGNTLDDMNKTIMDEYLKACDHLVFDHSGVVSEENPKFCFSKQYIQYIAEEIYTMIENSKIEEKVQSKFSLNELMNDNSDQSEDNNSDIDTNSSSNNSNESNNNNQSGNNNSSDETTESDYKSTKMNDEHTESNPGSGTNSNSKFSSNNNMSNSESGLTANDIEITVTKTTYRLPDGSKYTVNDINWPENYQLPDELKQSEEKMDRQKQNSSTNRSLMENQLTEFAKQKGKMSSDCSKFLKKLFHIKIDWVKILRNSLQTVLEKSDYFAWNKVRTSSFLLPNMPYLPDIVEDEEKYGTLIISRDESGSMTDTEIAKAGGIILDAKAFYKKIVLIKHDSKISKVYEFEEISDEIINVLINRESCGGTSHKDVFEYLHDYRKTHAGEVISCYIGITDLESDIHTYQKLIPSEVPVIYLAPINSEHMWNGIKGRIIPVEL
jgi:hypothetical protein